MTWNDKDQLSRSIDHEKLMEIIFSYSSTELGRVKMEEIAKNVHSSGKVKRFLQKAGELNQVPGTGDFVGTIISSINFTFSKAEVLFVASIILLKKWDFEVGMPLGLADDQILNSRLFSILESCQAKKIKVNSQECFFTRLIQKIEMIPFLKKIELEQDHFTRDFTVYFDEVQCFALEIGTKRVFRMADKKLVVLNQFANQMVLESFSVSDGAVFRVSENLGSIKIRTPFFKNQILEVFNSDYNSDTGIRIRVLSVTLRRLKEIENDEAIDEGFDLYEGEIMRIKENDPSLEAEKILFQFLWRKKYRTSHLQNDWLWECRFEICSGEAEEDSISLLEKLAGI